MKESREKSINKLLEESLKKFWGEFRIKSLEESLTKNRREFKKKILEQILQESDVKSMWLERFWKFRFYFPASC